MAWQDKVKNKFIVTTGDGKNYFPYWLNAAKSYDFNTAEFEFINISGTLVGRKTPKGKRYNIEIYFSGEYTDGDHLDIAAEFDKSSQDPRRWTIQHPLYGKIIVQPLNLTFDNRDFNITKITGTVVETITQDQPKITVDPVDRIILDKETADQLISVVFETDIPAPTTHDKNTLTTNTSNLYNRIKDKIKDTVDAEAYFGLFNSANAAINKATTDPLSAIRAVQAMINAPFGFADTVRNRIAMLVSQFQTLQTSIANIAGKNDKRIYENNTGTLITSMCACAVTNYDYSNRSDVFQVAQNITDSYNSYLDSLDDLQDANGGNPDNFIPDGDSQIAISNIVDFTLANLFIIANNARQSRTIYLENDSNLIILTHRFFGLTVDDSTIDEFMNLNDIGLNELIEIKKGRPITYYV